MRKAQNIIRATLSHVALFFGWLWGLYIFRFLNKVEVVGRENLLRTTGILYLSNHQTLIDSFLIGACVLNFWEILFYPRRVPWNAPDKGNFFKHLIGRYVFSLLKNIPVTRKTRNRQVMQEQIDKFCQAIDDSNLVLFFEGTRTRTREIGECKAGVAKTILEAKPKYIVPIWLDGIQPIMPVDAGFNFTKIKWGHRGRIVIGQPVVFADLYQLPDNGNTRRLVAQRVRDSVMALQTTNA